MVASGSVVLAATSPTPDASPAPALLRQKGATGRLVLLLQLHCASVTSWLDGSGARLATAGTGSGAQQEPGLGLGRAGGAVQELGGGTGARRRSQPGAAARRGTDVGRRVRGGVVED
jgi:hypothetical protein